MKVKNESEKKSKKKQKKTFSTNNGWLRFHDSWRKLILFDAIEYFKCQTQSRKIKAVNEIENKLKITSF